MLHKMTDNQLDRVYRRACNRLNRLFEGGMSFGIDMRTLRIVSPSWHKTIGDIIAEVMSRR